MDKRGIADFFHKHEDIIFPEHLDIFRKFMDKYYDIEETYIINQHGRHLTACSWSNRETRCGPDTCICVYSRLIKDDLISIIQKYKDILKE